MLTDLAIESNFAIRQLKISKSMMELSKLCFGENDDTYRTCKNTYEKELKTVTNKFHNTPIWNTMKDKL